MIKIALKSLVSRWFVTLLLVITIAIGTALIALVETVRDASEAGFIHTVTGTDLIVASRNSDLAILLNSVFLRGGQLYPLSSDALDKIRQQQEVKWIAPISLGDYFRGYPVIGTTPTFLREFRYGRDLAHLVMEEGEADRLPLAAPLTAILGSEVAHKTKTQNGATIRLSHGKRVSFSAHQHKEDITVSGILAATGTPIDRAVLVSLSSIDTIHQGWEDGRAPDNITRLIAQKQRDAKRALNNGLSNTHGEDDIDAVSAVYVGLSSPQSVLHVKNGLENLDDVPLSAVMPGPTLLEFWQVMRSFEFSLKWVSIAVVICALLGMLCVSLALTEQRQREIALYRAIGANRRFIYRIMSLEAFIIGLIGTLCGLFISLVVIQILQPYMIALAGIRLENYRVWSNVAIWLVIVVSLSCVVINLFPLANSYRHQYLKGLNS